jgi:chemotaxis protein CheX
VVPLIAEIEDIAQSIWATLFDIALETGGSLDLGSESTVCSCVQIDGAWSGAVVLKCPLSLAALLTSAMFQSGDEPGMDEIRDALGELANMLAGNIKGLLPEPCRVSLPAVAIGSDFELGVVGTKMVRTVSFTYAGHPLLILLLRRSVDADMGGPWSN